MVKRWLNTCAISIGREQNISAVVQCAAYWRSTLTRNGPNRLRLFLMDKQFERARSQARRTGPTAPIRPADSTMDIVILGLSITSSWGNGHAITYRGLVSELARRGHRILFLERDVPWYAENRDLSRTRHGRVELYADLPELKRRFAGEIRSA